MTFKCWLLGFGSGVLLAAIFIAAAFLDAILDFIDNLK